MWTTSRPKGRTVPSDSKMYHLLEHGWRFEEYRRTNARCMGHSGVDVCCDVLTGQNNVMFLPACPGVYIPGQTWPPSAPPPAKRRKMSLNSHLPPGKRRSNRVNEEGPIGDTAICSHWRSGDRYTVTGSRPHESPVARAPVIWCERCFFFKLSIQTCTWPNLISFIIFYTDFLELFQTVREFSYGAANDGCLLRSNSIGEEPEVKKVFNVKRQKPIMFLVRLTIIKNHFYLKFRRKFLRWIEWKLNFF